MIGSIARQLLILAVFTALPALLASSIDLNSIYGALIGLALWALLTVFWIAELQRWTASQLTLPKPKLPLEMERVVETLVRYRDQTDAEYDEVHEDMNQFEAATQAMSDAVIIIDRKNRIEWWNRSAQTIFGLKPDQRMLSPEELINEPEFVEFYQNPKAERSLKLESPNGQRTLEYRIHRFGEKNRERVLIARDVTENERFEQMRQTFLANASHELRTPITVIHGFLETLREQELPAPIARAIGTMQSQSNRMVALIADLLTLSRLETSAENRSRQPIQVRDMLTNIANEARDVSGDQQHAISLEMVEGLDILGNEAEIRSALSNLVFNAVRYTPAQGTIAIKLEAMERGALFSVTDNGEGIAAEHIPRITERFYRVDEGRSRDSGGTGLGLAIVKHVLVRHNATLGVSSKLGEGSRFSITFPAHRVTHD